jgi:hypothetical protein
LIFQSFCCSSLWALRRCERLFFINRPREAISAFDVQKKRLLIEYLAGPVRIASGRPGKARGLINRNQLAEIDLGCAE